MLILITWWRYLYRQASDTVLRIPAFGDIRTAERNCCLGVFCPWRPRSLCALRLVFVHHSKRLCNGLPPTSIRKVHMRRDTSEGAIESASRRSGPRYVIQYTRVGIAE